MIFILWKFKNKVCLEGQTFLNTQAQFILLTVMGIFQKVMETKDEMILLQNKFEIHE